VLEDSYDLIGVSVPPVPFRENFHLQESLVAGVLHHCRDPREIDNAVAHHAGVEAEIAGIREPASSHVGDGSEGSRFVLMSPSAANCD